MPSSISFLPAPASSAAPSAPSSDQPSGGADVSFDSVLTQAAPPSGKPVPRTAVIGAARAAIESDKAAKVAKDLKAAAESADADTEPSLLSPEELAALLALIGAPVALQQTPPPAVPVDFNPAGDTRCPDSADVHVECEADFSAPQSTTGKRREVFAPRAPGAREPDTKSAFTLDTGSCDAETTARDLLKQGAEVLDYQIAVTEAPAASAATVQPAASAALGADDLVASADAGVLRALPETLLNSPASSPAAQSAIEAVAQLQSTPAPSGQPADTAAPRRSAAQKTGAKTGSEKFAATLDSAAPEYTSGVKSSIDASKNKFLTIDNDKVTIEPVKVGTSAANWGDSMTPDARSTPFAARLIDGALSLLGTSSAGRTSTDRPVETTAAAAASAPQAAQIVSEIRDIADSLWAVERSSVEVRFHFSEHERLSVKVEYRNGVVQTTFRTDSPELRDTIAREWQSQVASASESRPYRVADPVFSTPPADARGFSLGGDASRQQRQAGQSAGAPHTFATTSGRGPSSSSVAAAPAAGFIRPDTALHLHAFA